MNAVFDLNMTSERRAEMLDNCFMNHLVLCDNFSIINSFTDLEKFMSLFSALWFGFEQIKLLSAILSCT